MGIADSFLELKYSWRLIWPASVVEKRVSSSGLDRISRASPVSLKTLLIVGLFSNVFTGLYCRVDSQ